jgi:histidine ammonia-lyase
VEFLAPLSPGAGGRAAHDFIRTLSPAVLEDRPLAPDIEAVAESIRSGELVDAVESEVGELA